MSQTAARPSNAVDPDVKDGEVVVQENPRQAAIDAMTERMESSRQTELDEAIAADPGLAQQQADMDAAIEAENDAARADGTLPPARMDADGALTREPMHEPAAAAPKDPLSEFVVMKDGEQMFQVKVNGQTKLIPLDQAKRQLQIGVAAETRMEQAALYENHTTKALQERERAIAVKEQALLQRTQQAATTIPAKADLSEEDLLDEAREIFSTAFSGTEEDAAKALAKTLTKIRAPGKESVTPVDESVLVAKASKAAVDAINRKEQDRDVLTGYEQFQKDYPDIMNDPRLYRMADNMTDEIEKANPTWPISRVMDEAGKQTRSWVESVSGKAYTPPATDSKTSGDLRHSTQEVNRQERKQGLVKIPAAAAGAIHADPADEPEREQTPQEAFEQLKNARGQPV